MAEAVAGAPRSSTPPSRAAVARALALVLPAALLAGAFGSQYFGGLYPCEMCWWQRYAHEVALVPAALAFTADAGSRRSRMFVLFAALAIAVSGAIGFYHAGVELKIFEGFTTCTSTAHGSSTEDLLKQIVAAPLIRCDQVQCLFLGISLAGWNANPVLGGAAEIGLPGAQGDRGDERGGAPATVAPTRIRAPCRPGPANMERPASMPASSRCSAPTARKPS
jgi:disulfide bond formation protein DsbB